MEAAPAIARMEWSECLLPEGEVPRAVRAEARRTLRVVPAWVSRLAPSPWLLRACFRLMDSRRPIAHAPIELCELIALVVSRDNSCRYCYGAQRTFLAVLGIPEERIARLERDLEVSDLSAGERAALDFARKISRSDPRATRSDVEGLLRAGFDRVAVAELAFSAASTVFMNRVATLLALPPEPSEGMVDKPIFRLMKPLAAWWLRPRPRDPEPLPVPNDGPCAEVVAALAGSPSAGVLRRTIDEAMASEVLPRRAKVLMLAVIGRALGCERSQDEARRLLAPAGLDAAAIEEILAHLGSPALDPLEAMLVPFARETVRSQAVAIQQRTRVLAAALTTDQVLEVVGIASLANAVCRLSVLLDVC